MPLTLQEIQQHFYINKQEIFLTYQNKESPSIFFKRYGSIVETLLGHLWQYFFKNEHLCLIATGGFGRNELYPYSDLDLAIVSPITIDENTQNTISLFVQTLWDMKLVPSIKSGSIKELCHSIKEDITGDTAFLEARFLYGNHLLAEELLININQQRDVTAFIEAKLGEMQQRHEKYQGSGALLEPNIKSCPGGLRDIHTMLWIAQAQNLDTRISTLIGQNILTRAEASMLTQGYKQLSRIRINLHLTANRAEERLIFDLQTQVAERMGWHDDSQQRKSEQLMRLFYRASKKIKQLNGILIPMLQGRIYSLPSKITHPINEHYHQVNNQIAANNPQIFIQYPEHIFQIIQILQSRNDLTSIEPTTLRAWWGATRQINQHFYKNIHIRQQFIHFFKHGTGLTHAMRFLNLYGVLGRYLPAWEKITGLLQHDLFHIYPVDDHILTVLHNIRRLSLDTRSHEQPFASALMQAFPKQYILYLAAFFHDIAKGRRGDHAIEGIKDAKQFSKDHFLNEEDSHLLSWLVEHHLLMSTVAQKEDIQDPSVIDHFCKIVMTQEKLTALYLLTIADIKGTNPKLWNSWRASLLESLFNSASRYLAGKMGNASTIFNQRQQEAINLLSRTGTPDKQQKKLWTALGSAYFARHQLREILWHTANLVHDFETPLIRSRILPKSDTFQIMIFMPNGPRLFARLCRIFSRHGFDILAARAFITEHNYILDTFIVQVPSQHDSNDYPNIQSALEAELNSFIHGYSVHEEVKKQTHTLSRRSRHIPISPRVILSAEEDFPGWYTVEIIAVNRNFLLADIAEVFFLHDVSLRYAKISTLGERVEDSFMVYSLSLDNPKNQLALKQSLLKHLSI